MIAKNKYRILKIGGIVLLSLLAIGGGVLMYLSHHYRGIIQAKLPEVAAKATDSLYKITVGDFSVNVITQTITLTHLHMQPDTAVVARWRREGRAPHVLLEVTVPELEVSGLKWADVATDKEVVCDEVGIYHPKIKITITDDPQVTDSLRQKRKSAIDRIFTSYIYIKDPQITFNQGSGEDAFSVVSKGGSIRAYDWDFHPRERSDSSRFFYARRANVQLEQLAWKKPGSLYVFGMDTIHFVSENHALVLAGVYVKPTVTKAEFYKEVGVQKEIYEGDFSLVRLNNFNWEQFITQQSVSAKSMDVAHANLDIYLSRLPPANKKSKVGNYPPQLLKKLSFPLNIPIVNIYKGAFKYTELNEKTKMPGSLDFSDIHGQIINVTNQKELIKDNSHCYIKLYGKFMRKSNMNATFDFPLMSNNGAFSVKGQLLELQGDQISESAKALALAEIKSLKLHKFEFSITGNDTSGNGEFSIRYNDLKIKLQKVVDDSRRLKSRGFLSFLANGLLLYNDNPMEGEDLRLATTHVVRDSTKSFFNLIWRNMFNAFLQTAIRNEGLTDIVKKKQANKGKEKVHFFRKLFPKRKKDKDTSKTSFGNDLPCHNVASVTMQHTVLYFNGAS